jgi:hypothetical protein
MAVSKPNAAADVRNDGGTIVKANGKGSDSPITVGTSLVELAVGDDGNGSVVLENAYTEKAVDSGTFAFTPAKGEDFLLYMAGPNADSVNGSSSTILSVGGRYNIDAFDGVNELSSTRGSDGTLVDFGEDLAASPSRAVPGELVFMAGGKTPETNAYKSRSVAE